MDLTSLKTIKELLSVHEAKPSKRMGQNFLIDKKALSTIIAAARLTSEDTIVEVGPGLGTLTSELAQYVKKVIAIEKDRHMLQILEETLKEYNNVEIIQQNALTFEPPKDPYKVVANIPYYLTSPLIRKFLEAKNPPTSMVLMVQKEVAQRICATPPNMSLLAVSVQFYAQPKIISYISKGAFWPSPKVDSAIIEITPLKDIKKVSSKDFFTVVKAGFSQPRKQLGNNLSTTLKKDKNEVIKWLLGNNIQPTQRAETLRIKDWEGLTNTLNGILIR